MSTRWQLLVPISWSWCALLPAQGRPPSAPPSGTRGDPHAERVVFYSDVRQDEVYELYGAPADGSAPPVRLNDPLPAGGDVGAMEQVAGGRVLYMADGRANDVFELFSVPNDGSAPPVRLNGPLVTGGDVRSFAAGKRRVVYRADATVDGRHELFGAPLDGSTSPIALTPGIDVSDEDRMLISRDGSLVLFTQPTAAKESLHVVPTDGSRAPRLVADSGEWPLARTLLERVAFAARGVYAVYLAGVEGGTFHHMDVFSVRLDGSTPPLKLNPHPIRFGAHYFFEVAPDGERVLFTSNLELPVRLLSIRLDGTGLVNLVPDGGNVETYYHRSGLAAAPGDRIRMTGDGRYAVFPIRFGDGTSVYRVRLDGSEAQQIHPPIRERILALELAPDGRTAVFAAEDGEFSTLLFAASGPEDFVLLSGDPPPRQGVIQLLDFRSIVVTPDGKSAVFLGDLRQDGVVELHSVRLDGRHLRQLNPPLPRLQSVRTFRVSGDGRRVIYNAEQSADDVYELFSARVDGVGSPIRLNDPPVPGGDVWVYATEPPTGAPRDHASSDASSGRGRERGR